MLGIDDVFGVDWEDLKGIPCRAYHSWGNVKAIGHCLKDNWLWFDDKTLEFRVTAFKELVSLTNKEE